MLFLCYSQGCIAEQGTPHLCGIADENPTTSASVDQQPHVSYPTTTATAATTWHQAPNIVTHQPPGVVTYAAPPTGGHVIVYADSQPAYLHDPYHVTNVMQSGYATGITRPFYGGITNPGTVEMTSSTRCSCGDPTCNQFVTVDVVGSTRVHQGMLQSNVFNGRNVYGLGPQQPQQAYASPYPHLYQHQVFQQQQQQPQHHQPPIGPSGYTNVHSVVGPHQHLPVRWPPIGNSYMAATPAVSIDYGQRGLQQDGQAHTVVPEVVHRLSTDGSVASGGDSRIQTEAMNRGLTSTMVESRSEQSQPDPRHTGSSTGYTADGNENKNTSERLSNKASSDVNITTSTVSHESQFQIIYFT